MISHRAGLDHSRLRWIDWLRVRQLIAESKRTVVVHRDVGRCNVYDRAFLARKLAANNQGVPCRHRRKLTVACTIQEPLRLADAEHVFATVEQNTVGCHTHIQCTNANRFRCALFQELNAVSIFCIVAFPCLAHRSAGAGRPDELCILGRMISMRDQTADLNSLGFCRRQLIAESKCTVVVHRDVGRRNVYDRAFLTRELAANNQCIPCRHRRKLTVACTVQIPLRLADAEHILSAV